MTEPHPARIKLDRRTGWRMPPGAIKVARRSHFANPYPVADFDGDHAAAVAAYRQWLDDPNAQPVRCGTKPYHRPTPLGDQVSTYLLVCSPPPAEAVRAVRSAGTNRSTEMSQPSRARSAPGAAPSCRAGRDYYLVCG
jgi:hypothetical protein